MNPLEQQYQYFAFISYSSKDMRWGRQLQKKLERYRLPARLASKRKDAPNRAYPVFRDETDLSGFKVRDSLKRELEESRFLIVICSPQSAKSQWVNDEIQYFIDHGREDRILPFIVEGVPYSGDPATECFPPALRTMQEDPLGVDVTALGKRRAYLRLVSALLDVKFNELIQRDTARRVRNGIVLGLLGMLLAAGAAVGIWYNTEHSSYYNAVTYQNEIPVGLYPLSKAEYATASDSYRITTLRGKVIRLENVNSLGTVKDPDFATSLTDYPIVEYQYDDNGELIAIFQKDETGKEVFRKDLTVNKQTRQIAIDFHSPSNALNAQALAADMTSAMIHDQDSDDRSEITRQRNTYDENGYLIRTLYQRDNLGTPACDANGVYGKAYAYNDLGQVIRISNLDENSQVFNCKYGWAYEEFTYDDRGNEIQSQLFHAQGDPARGKAGYSMTQIQYDANGNAVVWRRLDENGEPIENIPTTCFTYDSQGMATSLQVFAADGSATYDESGIHQIRMTRDALGRICAVSYFDTQGQPLYSPDQSCAAYSTVLDAQGRVLELWKYDTQGQLTFNRAIGAYGQRSFYDENGNRTRIEHLDQQGNLMTASGGYAVSIAVYDENGRVIREEYRDPQGTLVRSTDNIAAMEITYDTFGNFSGYTCYDENGQPCFHADGCCSVAFTYEDGNPTSIRYFSTDGSPMLCAGHYHALRREYDEKGNPIRWSYYDTQGNLLDLKDNYAVAEQDYDTYGNVTAKRYFSAQLQPASVDDSYAIAWQYDDRGNIIREELSAFFPELMDYVITELAYDDRDNCIQERYLDQNGDPIVSDSRAAQINYAYDAQGNPLEVAWLDHKGDPMQAGSDTVENLRRQRFDTFGNKTLVQHLNRDAVGKETCLWQERYTYDQLGNCIRIEDLDGSGVPRLNEYGYATAVQAFSPQGYLVMEEFYDDQDQPCLYNGLAFRYEYTRSPMGRVSQMRIYGTDGKLLTEDTGLAAYTCYEYDSRGLQVKKTYLNETGEPFGTEDDPVSRIEYAIDAMGYDIGASYYNKDGTLISVHQPYTYIQYVYPNSAAEEAGIQANVFLIALGDWCMFDLDTPSPLHDLQTALTNSVHTEKELVLCQWDDDDTFHFRRVHLPEGAAGYNVYSDTGDAQILARMKAAYDQWRNQ